MLDWAMAMMLPKSIDNSDRTSSMPCQSNASADSEPTSSRMAKANAASFGAEPMNSVTAVGAPS